MQHSSQHTFRALSDPTRREILGLLAQRDMTIAQVAGNFNMTRAAVKKHLAILKEGALIDVRAEGRERWNSINPQGFQPVRDWLSMFDIFWDERLATLKTAIENKETPHD